MCIRDRFSRNVAWGVTVAGAIESESSKGGYAAVALGMRGCLLYTSDAADERSSVDLGGRRIIKKKKKYKHTLIPNIV